MVQLYNIILYQPIFNLLVFFYNIVPDHDMGVAIILLTVLIKLVLYPFSIKSIKSQKMMRDIQPKLDALKEKYKNQKDKLAQEMMAFYKREKVNPFSSCLPLLLQLPFLIAVFQVLKAISKTESLNLLYPFIHNPGSLNPVSFGLFNLANAVPLFAILAGLAQFWQTKMMATSQPPKEVAKSKGAKDESTTAIINKQMVYMMPAITVIIGLTLPGGLSLYWFLSTLLMVAQQYYFFRKDGDNKQENAIIKQ